MVLDGKRCIVDICYYDEICLIEVNVYQPAQSQTYRLHLSSISLPMLVDALTIEEKTSSTSQKMKKVLTGLAFKVWI